MNVSKMSFLYVMECLEDVFFVRYDGCFIDIFFVRYVCLEDVFFVRYECLKDVFIHLQVYKVYIVH